MTNKYELYHYGVLGMKWGVHRFRNEDGTLTLEGKKKYRPDSALGNVGRALTNTTVGQRLIGVGVNKGYREDKKEIKNAYKNLLNEYKNEDATDKNKIKTLKKDYKKTLEEARITAANALYSHQTVSANRKIQTSNLGKQMAKSFLMSGFGALAYDRMSAVGTPKTLAAGIGFVLGLTSPQVNAGASIGDYIYGKRLYKKKGIRI